MVIGLPHEDFHIIPYGKRTERHISLLKTHGHKTAHQTKRRPSAECGILRRTSLHEKNRVPMFREQLAHGPFTYTFLRLQCKLITQSYLEYAVLGIREV